MTAVPLQRYSARELYAEAQQGDLDIPHLEIFNQPDLKVILRGMSHLVSGYAKVGKSELLFSWCVSWAAQGLRVAYYTEEPKLIWVYRIGVLTKAPDGFDVLPVLGMSYGSILADIEANDDDVVVIDTMKVLGIRDTNVDSPVVEKLIPIIKACRDRDATLILAHHHNKTGGDFGKGIAGSHAFLALVDVSLEVDRISNHKNRRKVTAIGRLLEFPEFTYEKTAEGFRYLGGTAEVGLETVERRLLEVMPEAFEQRMTQAELGEVIGDPKPSPTQMKNALDCLIKKSMIQRDPAARRPGAKYRYWMAEGVMAAEPHTLNIDPDTWDSAG